MDFPLFFRARMFMVILICFSVNIYFFTNYFNFKLVEDLAFMADVILLVGAFVAIFFLLFFIIEVYTIFCLNPWTH
jgi:hypothetical protein